MKVVKVTQLCLTLCDPMGYTVHRILQARILEWVASILLQGIFPSQGLKPGLPHCRHKDGHNKGQKWYGLTEAEDIKERWQDTEELYKKDLHNPDNHDGVITHLEPDILESEVKWALESITTNKASGGDGIPVELFQILKDDAVKVLHTISQPIWKTQQWPQDWKRSVSFQSQRKTMPKNAQLLHNCTHLTC